MEGKWYVLEGVNPEPWRVGPVSVRRNHATGNSFPSVGQDQQLAAFQSAVKEAIEGATEIFGDLELKFYFWRRQDSYQGKTKRVQKHVVDATNMQKATEDALQGLIMANDQFVKHVETTIMEQGPDVTPRIVFYAAPWEKTEAGHDIPSEVWIQILKPETKQSSNVWKGPNV